MIKLDTSGVAAFNRALDLALAEFDREITVAFRGWTVKLFTQLVKDTPQWSGDLTANWNYSIGAPNLTYNETLNKALGEHPHNDQQVFHRGDDPAVGEALAQLSYVLPTWRDTVYFTNNTPIAAKVEAQTIYIRPINLVDGRIAMLAALVTKAERSGYVA
jgi:hypothetical protein